MTSDHALHHQTFCKCGEPCLSVFRQAVAAQRLIGPYPDRVTVTCPACGFAAIYSVEMAPVAATLLNGDEYTAPPETAEPGAPLFGYRLQPRYSLTPPAPVKITVSRDEPAGDLSAPEPERPAVVGLRALLGALGRAAADHADSFVTSAQAGPVSPLSWPQPAPAAAVTRPADWPEYWPWPLPPDWPTAGPVTE